MKNITRPWFRLRVPPPRTAVAWLRWALDFKGRAETRAYLALVEERIGAAFPTRERERMARDLIAFGAAEVRLASTPPSVAAG